jgi:hypothetical protein
MRWLPVFLAVALALSAGCTGERQVQSTAPNPFQPEIAPKQQVSYIPLSQVPRASAPGVFEPVFVENLSGMVPLPQAAITMPTDISNFAPEVASRILGKIRSRFGALYVEGENTTAVVSFEAYYFDDPALALEALRVYRQNWNTLRFSHADRELWIWEGYLEQSSPPAWAAKGSHIFWDSSTGRASLGGGDAVVASIAEDLYCYHGEAALGNYFVMVDVHLPRERVVEEGQRIFAEYLERVAVNASPVGGLAVEEAPAAVNLSSDVQSRIAQLEAKREEITQAYLENKISLELYNYTLQKIEEELERIKREAATP